MLFFVKVTVQEFPVLHVFVICFISSLGFGAASHLLLMCAQVLCTMSLVSLWHKSYLHYIRLKEDGTDDLRLLAIFMTPSESKNASDLDTPEESGTKNRWCRFFLWVLLLTERSTTEILSRKLWKQQMVANTRGGMPGNLGKCLIEGAQFDANFYLVERLHIMCMFPDFWLAPSKRGRFEARNCCCYSL